MNRLGDIFKIIRPYSKYLVQSILASVVTILFQIPAPYFTRILIDNVFPNQDISLLGFLAIIQLALAVFGAVFGALHGYFQVSIGLRMSFDIGQKFLRHLESLSFSFFDERRTGEVISRFSDAHGTINKTVQLLTSIFLSVAQLLIFPIVLLLMNWKLTLIALAVYPLDFLIFRVMNRKLYRFGKAAAEESADLKASLYESLAGIRTIQALGVEKHAEERVVKQMTKAIGEQLKVGGTAQTGRALSTLTRAGGTLLVTWFGWNYVISGEMSLGSLMAFNLYLGFLTNPIQQLFSVSQSFQQVLVHSRRFFEIYDVKPEIGDPHEGAVDLARGHPHIRMQNVSFRYRKGPMVLRDISLDIEPGTMIALVGKSGAGKSTLVNLIPRFYDPTHGQIFMNNRDLRSYNVRSVRDSIGYVMQSNSFFFGTIHSALTMGDHSITMDRIEEAAANACIRDFIETLPDGYYSQLGEAGLNLSQGQLQRLALARVFLQDRPLLILDEPTSALDHESETYIRASLEKLRESRTLIVIAHRLSTIQSADKIVVLDDGKIAETGTFDELMQKDGYFHGLHAGYARI